MESQELEVTNVTQMRTRAKTGLEMNLPQTGVSQSKTDEYDANTPTNPEHAGQSVSIVS